MAVSLGPVITLSMLVLLCLCHLFIVLLTCFKGDVDDDKNCNAFDRPSNTQQSCPWSGSTRSCRGWTGLTVSNVLYFMGIILNLPNISSGYVAYVHLDFYCQTSAVLDYNLSGL